MQKGEKIMTKNTAITVILIIFLTLGCNNTIVKRPINQFSRQANDCKKGLWITNDSLLSITIGHYKNCVLDGKVKTLFASGEMCITHYKQGIKHGITTYYRTDGIAYVVQWYNNGNKAKEIIYAPKW